MTVKWSKMSIDFYPVQDYNFVRNYIKDSKSNCRNMLTIRFKSFTLELENICSHCLLKGEY